MNNLTDFKLSNAQLANINFANASSKAFQYKNAMTRRQSLKWFGILSATAVLPTISGCSTLKDVQALIVGHWPDIKLAPITAKGYGKDPNLILPPESPWPLTLTTEQLSLVSVLSDIICPREGSVPSATEVGVPAVIDEWVSAPYDMQQEHRLYLLSGLTWLDDESQQRFKEKFVQLSNKQQLTIIDDIAYDNEDTPSEFRFIAQVFALMNQLVLSAFFSSPEGAKDIGYMGNVAIAGDYPGPTEEAMEHLNQKLKELGL